VFPYVSYWSYDGAGMVLAANHPLDPLTARREYVAARLSARGGLSRTVAEDLMHRTVQGRLLSEPAVDRLIRERRPVINTDQNRHLEYATPKYSSAERDWEKSNVEFLREWERQTPAAPQAKE